MNKQTNSSSSPTRFDALAVTLEIVRLLPRKLPDAGLLDQMRRAAASIAENLAEGRGRLGRERAQLWRYAFGSAEELEATLQVAEAFGYLESDAIAEVLALLDRLLNDAEAILQFRLDGGTAPSTSDEP